MNLEVQLGRLRTGESGDGCVGHLWIRPRDEKSGRSGAAWRHRPQRPSLSSRGSAMRRGERSKLRAVCSTRSGWITTGLDAFIEHHLPYLSRLGAGGRRQYRRSRLRRICRDDRQALDQAEGVDAIELNVSCPNVSGGVDFGVDPKMCEKVVAGCVQYNRDRRSSPNSHPTSRPWPKLLKQQRPAARIRFH